MITLQLSITVPSNTPLDTLVLLNADLLEVVRKVLDEQEDYENMFRE